MENVFLGRSDGSRPKWPASTQRKKLSFPIKNANNKDVRKIRHEAFKNNPFDIFPPDSHPKSILKNPMKNAKSPNPKPSTSNGSSNVTGKDPLKKPKHKPITFDKEEDDPAYKPKKTSKHTPITFSNDEDYGSQQKLTEISRRKPSRFDAFDSHKQQSYGFTPSKDDSSDYYYKEGYSSGERRGSWGGYGSTSPTYAPSYSKPVFPNSSQIRHVNPQSRHVFQGNHR